MLCRSDQAVVYATDVALVATFPSTDPVPQSKREWAEFGRDIFQQWQQGEIVGVEAARLVTTKADAIVRKISLDIGLDSLCARHKVALVAVGGFGGQTMGIASDIDVIPVAESEDALAAVSQKLIQLSDKLRSLGLERADTALLVTDLSGIVNNPNLKQPEQLTSLFTVRQVLGDTGVFRKFTSTLRENLSTEVASVFEFLCTISKPADTPQSEIENVARFDLKNVRGGLRDIDRINWFKQLAAIIDVEDDFLQLLSPAEWSAVEAARKLLLGYKQGLHCMHVEAGMRGAEENTLTVAKFKQLCSLPDQDGQPSQGLESELATLHKARQVVTQALSTIIAPSAEDSQSTERDDLRGITDQIETEISPGATSEQVLGLCLEHVANLQSRLKEGEELSPDALEANCRTMRQTVAQIEAEVKLNEGHLEIFRSILSQPGYAGVAIQLMCEAGLIDRFFPDFKDLQFRPEIGRYEALPQIEQDHVYLLGQHAIQACLNLDKLLRDKTTGRDLDPQSVAPLYLALFRHEAGKLRETRHGEHCSIGAESLRKDCQRLGFSETAADLSARLVAQQSLMVDFVDTRICSNSSVIHEFSEAVKDESFLDLLYLFTVADGNPKHDQVQAVLQHDGIKALVESARRKINDPYSTSTARVTSLPEGSLPSDELIGLLNRFKKQDDLTEPLICWQPPKTGMPPHMRELLLVAQDRPGLFAEISTILCVEGLSIRQADLSYVEGIACDRVIVEHPQGTELYDDRLEQISPLLARPYGTIDECAAALARYLQGRRSAYLHRIEVTLHNPTIECRPVEVSSCSGASRYEITIATQDHVGVAATICVALAQVGASITSAKFGNRGRRVLNVLQVEFNEQSSTTGVSDRAALLSAQMTSELKKVQAGAEK